MEGIYRCKWWSLLSSVGSGKKAKETWRPFFFANDLEALVYWIWKFLVQLLGSGGCGLIGCKRTGLGLVALFLSMTLISNSLESVPWCS